MWDGTSLFFGRGNLAVSHNSLFFQGDTSAGTATFTASTIFKPGGGSFSASSDARLKDVHGRYLMGTNEVKQLMPIVFSYKNNTKEQFVGLIAQDVQKTAFSGMVSRGDDGYLKVDNSQLMYALVNAIKELDSRLTTMESSWIN
jgi:hypothetical protein